MERDNFEFRKVLKKAHFWLFVCGLFLVSSVALAYITCHIVSELNAPGIKKGPSKGLKSLSIKLTSQGNLDEAGEQADNLTRRYLDGVFVVEGGENIYPIAIMIDNNVFARPLSSLSRANLVYEAEVEGGATRYMAIFAEGRDSVEEIGPVRSARPYFIDWARELAALYVHCGGSPVALAKLAKENTLNLNEFYQGKYFWRDKRRHAPHNIYTSTESLYEYLAAKELDQGKFLSWQFKDDAKEDIRPDSNGIRIGFRLSSHIVLWRYDKISNRYIRYLDGRAHIDRSGRGITAKNVIIQYVDALTLDDELRLKMRHIGEGAAIACLDGICREGGWKKDSAAARTRFYDKNNEEIQFNAGTTWIEVVRPEVEVKIEFVANNL